MEMLALKDVHLDFMLITILIFVSHAKLIALSVTMFPTVLDVMIHTLWTFKQEIAYLNQIVIMDYSIITDLALENVNWDFTKIIILDIAKNARQTVDHATSLGLVMSVQMVMC